MPDAVKTVGRYEVVRELGRGGMATVYLARQLDLDRFVALKELGAFHAADPSFAQRFIRESRVAGSLSHPSIVTVHEYFEHDGTPYIAMEFVAGGSLRPFVAGRMTLVQISGTLEAVLAGLAHAEHQGIVHRDLKPENLMVTQDGRVKIADFGIAKATTSMHTGSFVTATGVTVGTPAYMAPEQAMAQDVGPWTDLYSVGCIAFEMFVGRVPFHDSDAPMAILLRHINEPIPPVKSIDPAIDPAISDWIEALLVKDPGARTRSATEAWDAYEEIADRLLPRRWRREARLAERTGVPAAPEPAEQREPTEPPPAPAPFTPPPPDLPPGPLLPPVEGQFDDAAEATFVMSEAAAPAPPPPRGEPRRVRAGALIAAGVLVVAAIAAVVLLGGGGGGGGGGDGDTGGSSQTVEVPDRPNAMGAIGDRIWVSTRAGTVGFTPPSDRLVERGREATQGGRTISGDDRSLWIPVPEDRRVVQLDAKTGAPEKVGITTQGTPKALAVSPDSVYVSQTDGTQTWLRRYDRATGGVRSQPIPVPEGTQRIALRDVIWVLAQMPGRDQVIRYADNGTELGSTPVGEGATAISYGGGYFWITGAKDGSLTRLDPETHATKRFRVGGNPQNARYGLGAVWVTNPERHALQRVDPRTGDVKDYAAGPRPFSLAITDTGVWVGDTSENDVRFVEP
jgi:predicted Ser/Thr protein kinase